MSSIVTTPLTDEVVVGLRAGDRVLLRGSVFTARDSAHKRMIEALGRGERLPFPPEGAVIYYVGPAPARPGRVIGSAGPTTSGRMDSYAVELMSRGVKGMIGKGYRSAAVLEGMAKYHAVYFAATGGAGALIARAIKASEMVAYEDLGPEAIRRLEVFDFPLVVVNDMYGNDLYKTGKEQYRRL